MLSRIVAMNFWSLSTRCHSPTTWTFTQLQITHRLHFPSVTAPTQLFTIISLAPVHHHPITHTLYKLWTFSHTLPSIVSPAMYKAFPELDFLCSQYPELDFLCHDSCTFLDYSLCLALWIKFADRRPKLA